MTKKKVLTKREKEEITYLLDDGEVGLWLNDYDFIFSDFDHRHFSQRALSQDFLSEAKRAVKEIQPDKFGFKLLLPDKLRKREWEIIIKKRLKQHFHKHSLHEQNELNKITHRSMYLCILGFIFMALAATIYNYSNNHLYLSFLMIILEPAGWFMVWFGFDNLFYSRNALKAEHEFYQKMSRAEIKFESY